MHNELEVIKQTLLRYDELTVMDLLQITTEDLIERFDDLIEANYEQIKATIEEENTTFGTYQWED